MPRTVLVTGAAGFAGSHLIDLLADDSVRVTAWHRPGGSPPRTVTGVTWEAVDLLDRRAVGAALTDLMPDVVYHCAGAPHVGQSWHTTESTFSANVRATHHVIEGLRDNKRSAHVMVASSALVYESSDRPLREDDVVRPSSPYAVSKLAQELVAVDGNDDLHVSIARAFNHFGPRQSPDFVASGFARRIAEIEAGHGEAELGVGNLDARRDLTDVRDTVRAYRAIVERGRPGRLYNVCSGRAVLIRDLLDMLIARARVPIAVRIDSNRYRPIDQPIVVGDPQRIRDEIGWTPEVPIGRTLDDLIQVLARAMCGTPVMQDAPPTAALQPQPPPGLPPLGRPLLRALVVLLAMTAIVTRPQIVHLGDSVYDHHDPFFSMWRLSWIAHALRTDPRHLFDANIFFPELRTLAYSDATMLQGLLATPFLWAGVPQILVYNVLLMIGVLSSGLGMFILARYLTRNDDAALVAAAVFTLLPYRIEHLMHLELEWTMWMPLAFWALHRAFDTRSNKAGIWVGIFICLQVLSCVYYGVFLSIVVSFIAILLIASRPAESWRAIPGLAAGALIGAVISGIYALPYRDSASIVGARALDEIALYSATPLSYLSSPYWNWLYGWTADRFGSGELRLFPGFVALGLAVIGCTRGPRRLVWIYLTMVVLVAELSLGLNGFIYPWLLRHVPPLHGFRVAARFSVLAFAGLSVLVAFGFARLRPSRLSASRWLVIVLAALVIEYGSAPVPLKRVTSGLPDLYRFVRGLEAGVVMEFPSSVPESLPRDDVDFQFWSTTHWKPMANGYSGYYSERYIRLLERVRKFPDDRSIEALRIAGVRYVIVHRSGYLANEYTEIMSELAARRDLASLGRFRDAADMAHVFALY